MFPIIIILFIVTAYSVFGIIFSIFYKEEIGLILLFGLLGLSSFYSILYLMIMKALLPIYVSAEKVKQGKVEYKWEDIKMTAVPNPSRSGRGYTLLLRTEYIRNLKAGRKEMKKGMCAVMYPRTLNTLLQHYKDKVLVLDSYGDEDTPRASIQKLNQMIISHNAKISCHSETTDCEANSSLPV